MWATFPRNGRALAFAEVAAAAISMKLLCGATRRVVRPYDPEMEVKTSVDLTGTFAEDLHTGFLSGGSPGNDEPSTAG